jgi:hemerythrin superfamily protein
MDIKKLLEVAGCDAHLKAEKKLFNDEVAPALTNLIAFCSRQSGSEYKTLKKDAEKLRDSLKKHLRRYE